MMEEEKSKRLALKEKIIGILKTCYDPEIPVDIFELGLIYEINVDDAMNVAVKMTLTSPACPAAGTLPPEVEQKIKDIPETENVALDIVWEPTWTPDMMSDIARYELGMM